jgi:hypothetical protein
VEARLRNLELHLSFALFEWKKCLEASSHVAEKEDLRDGETLERMVYKGPRS